MNIPKIVKCYCKKCNVHTDHKLKQFKSGAARAMSRGQRRNVAKKAGHGGKYQFTAIVKKQNKKAAFIAECIVCGAKTPFVIAKRMKKVETQ